MSSGKGGSGTPNPYKVADAQTQSNIATATTQQQLNMVDQTGPYSSTTYTQDGTWADGTPKYTQTTSYNDNYLDATNSALDTISGLNTAADANLSQIMEKLGTGFSYDDTAHTTWASGLYDQLNGTSNASDLENLRSRLAAQGIQEGSTAYNQAIQNLTTSQQNARNQFLLDSYDTGYNTAKDSYTMPFDTLSSLLGGVSAGTSLTQSADTNNTTPSVSVANTDLTSNVYSSAAQKQQAQTDLMGGLFGLGTSLIGLSDRRLKTDIKRVGVTDGGLPIYTYRYKGGTQVHMGVMAQDVAEMIPDAVAEIGGGYLGVDYGKVA